ncbi:MAG: ATP-binding protein [Actinomycetota bacterium]|nr:ATP-binding protein [Actinomycetota bacterium]
MNPNKHQIDSDRLRWVCDPQSFSFSSTEEVPPLIGVVGQDRAVHSLDFGFKIKTKGFNVYAAGPTGTGKHSAITSYVKELAADEPVPNDWCYVFNFSDPDKPIAIELTNGAAVGFAKDIAELIEACRSEIPKAFDSEEYERRKDSVLNELQGKREGDLDRLREDASTQGFSVELTTAGIVTVPVKDGRLMKREEFERLPEKEKAEIKSRTEALQADINRVMTSVRTLEKQAKNKVLELDKEIALFAIGHLLDDLRTKYSESEKVLQYLQSVQDDIVENLEAFKETEHQPELHLPGMEMPEPESPMEKYKVNLFVTHAKNHGAPVVFEPNPTYYNLFGRLEYGAKFGAMVTNFTMIKSGSVHRANGGYLILNALDVLLNVMSYDALKRCLKAHEAKIENIGEQYRLIPATTLQPEPMPIDVKVILIGSRFIYNLLYQHDEDFMKLFKVRADFQVDMDRSLEHTDKYAALISSRCRQDDLKHFDRTGIAKVVEYGTRLAEDQTKLSTRFIEINDLVSEASYWASTNDNSLVTGDDVQRAINEQIYRSNMIEEKIREMIVDGTIMIDIRGEAVGQLNGLAVISLGDYMFGKPSRITCKVAVGKKGVVNIERESKMSGQIYNKATMILSGYLAGQFAQDKPLAVSATIGFEQSYDMIEGDSASSTELYALLSSLAGVPIKQGIAVTGSVNQQGEVQPIGGVNTKIEGFYDVCKAIGLSGDQGVLIPGLNLKHLMLREDVVEAVKAGNWHIWAVNHINEGLEVLTGQPAGARLPDGTWEPNSINDLVNKRLKRLGEDLRQFESPEERRRAA